MLSEKSKLSEYQVHKTHIELADGNTLESPGKGYVHLEAKDQSTLKVKALHIPELAGTLISFGCLYKRSCDVVCTGKSSFNLVNNNTILLSAKIIGGTCNVKLKSLPQGQSLSQPTKSAKRTTAVDIDLLHRAAGHPGAKALKKMFPSIILKSMKCDACKLSKSHQQPFPGSLPKATRPLEFISMDLSGKISPASFGGKQYYFKITNHFTQFFHVYLLSSKSQTFSFCMEYYKKVINHHSTNIQTVVFDGGGEFNSNQFMSFLKSKGITVQVTAPYTPQQNAVAERANCTTSEKALCLLKQSHLPSKYWGEAVSTAVFLENITPVRKLKWKTPYQLWHSQPFDNTRLKPFGCVVSVNIPKSQCNGKFGDTSKKGLLVGYQHGTHNWHILLPGGKVERSHNVSFHVADFPGVSIFAPTNPSFQSNPLASLKFMEHDKSPNLDCTSGNSPPPSSQDVLNWLSAEDELDLDTSLIDINSFFPEHANQGQSHAPFLFHLPHPPFLIIHHLGQSPAMTLASPPTKRQKTSAPQ
jgi:hypothetical protein